MFFYMLFHFSSHSMQLNSILLYMYILFHYAAFYSILLHSISFDYFTFYFILLHAISFYCILFHSTCYFILLHSISFCCILFYSTTFYLILLYSISFCYFLFHYTTFYFIWLLFHSTAFHYILFQSILILCHSILLYYILFYFINRKWFLIIISAATRCRWTLNPFWLVNVGPMELNANILHWHQPLLNYQNIDHLHRLKQPINYAMPTNHGIFRGVSCFKLSKWKLFWYKNKPTIC